MASCWYRSLHWCGGRMKKGGMGMTILFLICFASFSLWPNSSLNISRDLPDLSVRSIRTRDMEHMSCQECKESPPAQAHPVGTRGGPVKSEQISTAQEMQRRREGVSRACASLSPDAIHRDMSHAMVSRPHKFLYCPVEKSASTFWRRFMYQLVLTHPMRSPFDVSVQTVYSFKFPGAQVSITEKGEDLNTLLKTSTKMLFIREPYSRLLSAYVDKLLAPNPILWNMWGKPAIELCTDPKSQSWCKDRSSKSKSPKGPGDVGISSAGGAASASKARRSPPLTCWDDATFPEFVKLVTTSLAYYNPHVMPIYTMCSPCHANYTIIGHMETFDRDVKFLLPRINITKEQVNLEKMDDNVAYDAIEDSVHDSMSKAWLRNSLRCITKLDVVKRIWRKLQIRGFVSWRVTPSHFHIDQTSAEALDGPGLTGILVQANLQSTNRTELKLQKRQALKEAFSSLQPEQFTDIWETFGLDFRLFGFEQRPKAFDEFGRDGFVTTDAFDWTKDWNMEKVL